MQNHQTQSRRYFEAKPFAVWNVQFSFLIGTPHLAGTKTIENKYHSFGNKLHLQAFIL